jgi:diaminohydroxyphosphoribosylaminopyrimidine deaminase/5-amino-6-(5-phosphoribosylamino)uracil reductase
VGIPRIVIGLEDPHEKVGGKGIAILRDAGCEVITGVLTHECKEHHRRFLTFHTKRRPYIILKWAQSTDGFMAPATSKRKPSPEPYWISSPVSRQLAHKWRSEEAGVLVGTQTALADNPKLDTRLWKGPNPVRILLDSQLRVPRDFHIFKPPGKCIVFYSSQNTPKDTGSILYRAVSGGKPLVTQFLNALWEEQIQSIIVEGGARTLNSFIQSGNWDEARIITGPSKLETGLEAPRLLKQPIDVYKSGPDTVRILRND